MQTRERGTLAVGQEARRCAHPRNKHVHRSDRLLVVVEPHVEGLDVLWIVVQDDRSLEDLLGEVPLVL